MLHAVFDPKVCLFSSSRLWRNFCCNVFKISKSRGDGGLINEEQSTNAITSNGLVLLCCWLGVCSDSGVREVSGGLGAKSTSI